METVNAWHAAGHFIHITSHRATDATTRPIAWLDAIGLRYDELYCSYDKITRCREIGIDVLVDDSPVNLERALDAGIIGATIVHPWNRELVATRRHRRRRRLAGARARRSRRCSQPGAPDAAASALATLASTAGAVAYIQGGPPLPGPDSLRVRRAHVITIAVVAALAVVFVGGAWAYDHSQQDTIATA